MIGENKVRQQGYVMLGVLLLNILAAAVIVGVMSQTGSNARSVGAFERRASTYYQTQESLSRAITWTRDNSANLVDLFSRDNFYTHFDRSVVPSTGINDNNGLFSVPTKIKLRGTSNSAIMASASSLATSAFPNGQGGSFSTLTEFGSADLGQVLVRVTLYDAIPQVPAKDYGDVDDGNPTPDTDFVPVFRVDALSATDRGTHVYGFVQGSLVMSQSLGFFGRDFIEMRQPCDSYDSSAGAYNSSGNRNANCTIGTAGPASIHQSETIYGSATAQGGVNTSNPFGGDVCANFSAGCPDAGQVCEGASCSVPALPSYQDFSDYCPGSLTNVNAGNNDTEYLTAGCYGNVTMHSNGTLIIDDTSGPIYVNYLDPKGTVTVLPGTGTVDLYLNSVKNSTINGNATLAASNGRPSQFNIHYLGSGGLTINGNSDIGAFVSAPYADVTIQGNADFFGGVMAQSLTATGNGDLHYDESEDTSGVTDMTFKINRVSQLYN